MSKENQTFTFLMSVNDFDLNLLPVHARRAGTEDFKTEVSKIFQNEYLAFGGWAQILVDDQTIRVTWGPDPSKPDPVEFALDKLRNGDYPTGVRLLQSLLRQMPDNAMILYNLGMALSDMGQLSKAEEYIRKSIALAGDDVNSWVALGVAQSRQGKNAEAAKTLAKAVELDPTNPWAQRNLGGCLLKSGAAKEAEAHFKQTTVLHPTDAAGWLGLARASQAIDLREQADRAYIRVIELDRNGEMGEMARQARSTIAQESFKAKAVGSLRPDALMYCLGALQRFQKMDKGDVQKLTLEISLLGRNGLDTNDSVQKYTLRGLPGNFSGLQLVCMMYVGFQQFAPQQDIGFDLSKEYEAAKSRM